MSIRIVLADDHRIVREGLREMLEKNDNFKVIGEAENGAQAVGLALELRPDIVVMDIAMPDINGIEATRQIVSRMPAVKILALSMHSDKRVIGKMFDAGASGYLRKDCTYDELIRAIDTLSSGQIFISTSVANTIVENIIKKSFGAGKEKSRLQTLSKREFEVLQLFAEGKSIKEVAHALHISTKTVSTHRQNILEKLEIQTFSELMKYAIRACSNEFRLDEDIQNSLQ